MLPLCFCEILLQETHFSASFKVTNSGMYRGEPKCNEASDNEHISQPLAWHFRGYFKSAVGFTVSAFHLLVTNTELIIVCYITETYLTFNNDLHSRADHNSWSVTCVTRIFTTISSRDFCNKQFAEFTIYLRMNAY